jgi:hypothetical protein
MKTSKMTMNIFQGRENDGNQSQKQTVSVKNCEKDINLSRQSKFGSYLFSNTKRFTQNRVADFY